MINKLLDERVPQPIGEFDASSWNVVKKGYIETLCREEYGMPIPAPTKLEF